MLINVRTAEQRLQFGPDKCHTLTIAYESVKSVATYVYINHWSETHDEKNHLVEQFQGKLQIKNVGWALFSLKIRPTLNISK